MTERNGIPWRYTTLRGLHSNKTTWHPDRDGFLEYFNLENMGEFSRLRRGGSTVIVSLALGTTYLAEQVPKIAMDFNWVDTKDAAATYNVRELLLAGNYAWYKVTSGGAISALSLTVYGKPTVERSRAAGVATLKVVAHGFANASTVSVFGLPAAYNGSHVITWIDADHFSYPNTGTGEGITADTGGRVHQNTIVYPARPSMCIVKDRIFLCTSARASFQQGTWSPTIGSKLLANTANWGDELKHGDPIFINGCKYTVDYRSATKTNLYLTSEFSGSITVNYKNGMSSRVGNLMVYDPNESRTGANKVSLAGAVAPPDQMVYDYISYFHDYPSDPAKAWVWVGYSPGNTYCNLRSGDEEVSFFSNAEAEKNTVDRKMDSNVATLHVTAHGYSTGDAIKVSGTGSGMYWGTYIITKDDNDHFHYTVQRGDTSKIAIIDGRDSGAGGDVINATDAITENGHGWSVNQPVLYKWDGTTNITGLVNNTIYYIKTITANTFTLSSLPGGALLPIAGEAGAGTHSHSFTEQSITSEALTVDANGRTSRVTPVGIPASVAVDDKFYVDDVEYNITGFENTPVIGGPRNIIKIAKNAGDAATTGYDGVDEIIIKTAADNELDAADPRWSLWYGNLTCDVQYALGYAYYNSKSGHISNCSPLSYLKTGYKKFNIIITQWNDLSDNDPNLSQHYDTIIFFRAKDGAAILQDTKRIASTTVPAPSTYVVDNIADDSLGTLYAPLAYTNNPPPSLMMIDEYQGRIFGIGNHERNKLFYSADEVQINATDEWGLGNGRAEECWPPTNYIIIPSEGGNGTSLKRCGDYLYVGTDNALFALTGSNQNNYSLEKIFSQDGVYAQSICEYAGPLTQGVPGAFFLTKSCRAYIIAPGVGLIEVGFSVLDKLQRFVGYSEVTVSRIQGAKRDYATATIGSMTYKSLKPRNYIAVTGFVGTTFTTHISLIYDIDMKEWYEHQHKYPADTEVNYANAQASFLYGTSVFGYPVPIGAGLSFGATVYSLNLIGLYNDNTYTDVGGAFSAYAQTSWHDFDQTYGRSTLKAMNRAKIYTTATGQFTADYFTDENAVAKRSGINFLTDEGERQEANGKEKIALIQSASAAGVGPGWLYGHSMSAKIYWPNAAIAESIEYLELEFNVQGQK